MGFVLVLLGIEHWTLFPGFTGVYAVDLDSIAWSHGLLPDVLWAGILAGGYFLWRRHAGGAHRGGYDHAGAKHHGGSAGAVHGASR